MNWKCSLIIILAALVGGGILTWQYWLAAEQEIQIPLSALAEKIEQTQVKSITIRGDSIKALLKDGTHLQSTKETETSLTEALLNYGVSGEKLKNIEIKVKEEGLLSVWFQAFPLLALGISIYTFILIVGFVVSYFLILALFKILHITGIPKSKVIIYILAMFFLGLSLNHVIPAVLKGVSNEFILYSANILISFLIVFLFMKYYFQLSGKKLWQVLLFLIILSLVFSVTQALIQIYGVYPLKLDTKMVFLR